MEKIRLAKYLSECGVMSRRAAEKEILAGNVTVNNEAVEVGRVIDPSKDRVAYKTKIIKKKRSAKNVYLMLNKPKGVVTTMSDEKQRKCVADYLADVPVRVYPVGRLDYESEGLLIMTNDGELANRLMHPVHEIPKIYNVRVKGKVTKAQMKKLGSELVIDGYTIMPVECRIIDDKGVNTVLEMKLYEGRNRQIRKMCEQCALSVIKLKRVAVGDLKLETLKPGEWKYLNKEQVDYLKGK